MRKTSFTETNEVKDYIEKYKLEPLIVDLVNATLTDNSERPIAFMIKYLSSLLSEQELLSHGICVNEKCADLTFSSKLSSEGGQEEKRGQEMKKEEKETWDDSDFPELNFKRVCSLEEINLEKSPERLKKIESVGSKSVSSGSFSD